LNEGNVDTDPVFDTTGASLCMLCATSPCIDNGIPDTTGLLLPAFDIAGNPRIWNNRIDMGAYEWNNVGEEELQVAGHRLQVSPNPAFGISVISYPLTAGRHVELTLNDITGKKIRTLVDEEQAIGEHTILFDTSGLPAGIYFIRLQSGNTFETVKVILMD
jgi:hypothetical protein